MKVSFISTVYNEEKNIEAFLCSLVNQKAVPEEIIIVDGGSTDKTIKKVESFRPKFKASKLVILKRPGSNRSQGRNLAIDKATGVIIVASDAGCILGWNWREEILKPFKKDQKIDVVSGFYLPTGTTLLQKLSGELTSVPIDRIDPKTFLPSSRSIAFKKSSWKEVGGYPENLNYCEDLVFNLRLKKAKKVFAFSSRAVVYWPQKNKLWSLIKQFFNYAVGDGMAGKEGPHFHKLWLRSYLICLILITVLLNPWFILPILFILFFCFLLKSIFFTIKIHDLLILPLALIVLPTLNFAVILGYFFGSLKSYGRKS